MVPTARSAHVRGGHPVVAGLTTQRWTGRSGSAHGDSGQSRQHDLRGVRGVVTNPVLHQLGEGLVGEAPVCTHPARCIDRHANPGARSHRVCRGTLSSTSSFASSTEYEPSVHSLAWASRTHPHFVYWPRKESAVTPHITTSDALSRAPRACARTLPPGAAHFWNRHPASRWWAHASLRTRLTR